MNKNYVCYEMDITMNKEEWLAWYEENGNKENFASADEWFVENVRMQNLNEI